MLNVAQFGLRFEALLRDELCRRLCDARWSKQADEQDMVDMTVFSIDGVAMTHPVEVQVTFQVGHMFKIRQYLATRGGRDGVSLYVEMAGAPRVVHVSTAIMAVVTAVQAMGPAARGIVGGLSVEVGGWKEFDLRAKLATLEEQADPARTAAKRRRGVIIECDDRGLTIIGDDGAEYRAAQGDIADLPLYIASKRAPEVVPSQRISFIPVRKSGHGRLVTSVITINVVKCHVLRAQ